MEKVAPRLGAKRHADVTLACVCERAREGRGARADAAPHVAEVDAYTGIGRPWIRIADTLSLHGSTAAKPPHAHADCLSPPPCADARPPHVPLRSEPLL